MTVMPSKCPICGRESLDGMNHSLGCWLGYYLLLAKSRAMMQELATMPANGYSVKLESDSE